MQRRRVVAPHLVGGENGGMKVRQPAPLQHYGDTIENILARCEAETGLPPPGWPEFEDRRLLAHSAASTG